MSETRKPGVYIRVKEGYNNLDLHVKGLIEQRNLEIDVSELQSRKLYSLNKDLQPFITRPSRYDLDNELCKVIAIYKI